MSSNHPLHLIEKSLIKYLDFLENGKVKKIDYSNKAEQINEYKWTRDEYSQYVFNPQSFEEIANVKPRIVFILPKTINPENPIELYQTNAFWNKMIIHTSSIHTQNIRPGRQIKYFLIDDTTKKIIGIISISSDILSIKTRDDHIGLSSLDLRKQNIHYLFNITTCVGVQPFSYNACLGKLLARTPFTREVQDEIKRRYGFYSLGFTTFSIHGRSVQYERIKELKYLGLTKGSFFIIPDDLYIEIKEYIKDYEPEYYNEVKSNPRAKQKIIMTMLEILNFNIRDFYHNIQRGIYFGFTDPSAKKLIISTNLKNEITGFTPTKLYNTQDLYNEWLIRWAMRRVTNLKSQHRFKSKVSWSVLDGVEKQRKYNQTYREKQIAEMGKAEYLEKERERKKKYQEPKCEKWWKTQEGLMKIRQLKSAGLKNKEILEVLNEIDGLTINILKKINV